LRREALGTAAAAVLAAGIVVGIVAGAVLRLLGLLLACAGSVVGITNAMDCAGTWAGEGLSVAQVEHHKKEAKMRLQEMLKLHVGEQYQLAVFLGRLTHQKGADIIAEVGTIVTIHAAFNLCDVGCLQLGNVLSFKWHNGFCMYDLGRSI
jgi:hypothetical protein